MMIWANMKKFKITKEEKILITILALAGFFFSSKKWLMFLDESNPITGLIIYYFIIFISFFFLSKLGLSLFKIEVKKTTQIIGIVLITFSFFIVFNWESQWVQYVTKGDVSSASSIFFQSEDGATFYFWNTILKIGMNTSRILTFVVTPIILTLLGSYLVIKPQLLF